MERSFSSMDYEPSTYFPRDTRIGFCKKTIFLALKKCAMHKGDKHQLNAVGKGRKHARSLIGDSYRQTVKFLGDLNDIDGYF